MFIMFIVSVILPVTLISLNYLLAKKEFIEREKPSPFECGFDPICSARLPFSLQFFLITVFFLIFDVEITLILPSIQSFWLMNMQILTFILILFLLILVLGLYLEWNQGALEWFF